MTRDLFHERCENDNINHAHHEYLKSCIEYLKWNDITDMIEEDTRSEVCVHDNDNDNLIRTRNELHDKIQTTTTTDIPEDDYAVDDESEYPPPLPAAALTQTSSLLSIANKMCIRKKTIDDFIVLKPADNHDIKAKLPKVRDYQHEIMKRASNAAADAD